jgi:hypothetical protein
MAAGHLPVFGQKLRRFTDTDEIPVPRLAAAPRGAGAAAMRPSRASARVNAG